MKIKAISKLPGFVTIPGGLDKKDFRLLQSGESIEAPQESAAYLIKNGYCSEVKEAKKKKGDK